MITKEINLPTGKPVSSIWDQQIGILGSGSDFTGFIQHIGTALLYCSMLTSFSRCYEHVDRVYQL